MKLDDFSDFRRLNDSTDQQRDWIEARLDELTPKEQMLLRGAVQEHPPQNGQELIELLINLPEYRLCFPVQNKQQLGEFVAREECGVRPEYMDYIDAEKLAERYMAEHPGVFTRKAYVEFPPERQSVRHYDGGSPEWLQDDDWSVKLKLASPQRPDGVWIKLPDYESVEDGRPDEIVVALNALGVHKIQECTLLEVKCILSEAGNIAEQYESLADLIYDAQNLGFMLDERGQGEPHFMDKFAAALEYEKCRTLAEAIDIGQNLSCYDYIPAAGFRAYAIEELGHVGGMKMNPMLEECFDLDSFAADLLERHGLYETSDERGFISRNDREFVPTHENPEPPHLVLV